MKKHDIRRSDAGSTLIELVVATVVLTTGMVAVLGGVTMLSVQNRTSEDRARAINYSMSQMEAIKGLTVAQLLNYVVPYDNQQQQTVNIPGSGPCSVRLYAVIPGVNGATTNLQLGSSEAMAYNQASVPNPVEIKAQITPYGSGTHPVYTMTTKVSF